MLTIVRPSCSLPRCARTIGPPQPVYDILDAGCGTGLCGVLLKPLARSLTGVDLSASMLKKAKQRGIYDRLVEDEITRFLSEHVAAFDVVASATRSATSATWLR